jgi:hypothetical protein
MPFAIESPASGRAGEEPEPSKGWTAVSCVVCVQRWRACSRSQSQCRLITTTPSDPRPPTAPKGRAGAGWNRTRRGQKSTCRRAVGRTGLGCGERVSRAELRRRAGTSLRGMASGAAGRSVEREAGGSTGDEGRRRRMEGGGGEAWRDADGPRSARHQHPTFIRPATREADLQNTRLPPSIACRDVRGGSADRVRRGADCEARS